MISPTLSSAQYTTLHDLYNSTNGLYWTYRNITDTENRWDFSTYMNPCLFSWQGLNCRCTATTCKVIGITLDRHNLTGTIPSIISNLAYLESLVLRGNSLEGSIPSATGYLSALQILDLGLNVLSKSIPSSIGELTGLVSLNLDGNLLTGEIPFELGFLTSLRGLGLSVNF
jgi:Leucine-rich repeat (LRR) protein